MGLLWAKGRTQHFVWLNLIPLTAAQWFSLSRSVCRAFLFFSRSTLPANLVSFATYRGCRGYPQVSVSWCPQTYITTGRYWPKQRGFPRDPWVSWCFSLFHIYTTRIRYLSYLDSNKTFIQQPLAKSTAMGLDFVWKANSSTSDNFLFFFSLYLLRHK